MGDLQLKRLVCSDEFPAYAKSVSERMANNVSLSSGERRLVNILKVVGTNYDFWLDEQLSHMAVAATVQ
jgi:hypothetical protein